MSFIDEVDRADQQMIEQRDVLIRRQYPDSSMIEGGCVAAQLLEQSRAASGGMHLTGDQVDDIISEGRLAAARNRQIK